jgi:hypothetical protein
LEFNFAVTVVVKDDALSRDAGRADLATLLAMHLAEANKDLLWVLSTDVSMIERRDTRP